MSVCVVPVSAPGNEELPDRKAKSPVSRRRAHGLTTRTYFPNMLLLSLAASDGDTPLVCCRGRKTREAERSRTLDRAGRWRATWPDCVARLAFCKPSEDLSVRVLGRLNAHGSPALLDVSSRSSCCLQLAPIAGEGSKHGTSAHGAQQDLRQCEESVARRRSRPLRPRLCLLSLPATS